MSMNKTQPTAKTCTTCPLCRKVLTAIGPQLLCLTKTGGCGSAFSVR